MEMSRDVSLLKTAQSLLTGRTINVLWLLFTVPWVGLQYVSVVFPDHTHLLFGFTTWLSPQCVGVGYVMELMDEN